jgi:hypothetical protein
VHIIRAGLANVSGLYSSLTVNDIVEEMTLSKIFPLFSLVFFIFSLFLEKEQCFIMCDNHTRESGRLTKEIVIMDFNHQGWFYPSQALIQSQNDASAISKMLYPQLLDKVIIINAPWFFKQLWKMATMVLSESLTSKVGMCTGTIEPGKLSECPWASKHLRPEDMPTFVGGTCSCPDGCVGKEEVISIILWISNGWFASGDVSNDCSEVKGIDLVAQEEEEWTEESGEEEEAGWFGGWFG